MLTYTCERVYSTLSVVADSNSCFHLAERNWRQLPLIKAPSTKRLRSLLTGIDEGSYSSDDPDPNIDAAAMLLLAPSDAATDDASPSGLRHGSALHEGGGAQDAAGAPEGSPSEGGEPASVVGEVVEPSQPHAPTLAGPCCRLSAGGGTESIADGRGYYLIEMYCPLNQVSRVLVRPVLDVAAHFLKVGQLIEPCCFGAESLVGSTIHACSHRCKLRIALKIVLDVRSMYSTRSGIQEQESDRLCQGSAIVAFGLHPLLQVSRHD